MGSVLYAWELGAALGHIGTFLPVARELRQRQHEVHWAVTQTQQTARLLPDAGFDWLQAPLMPEQPGATPPLNYADILLRFGYANATDLLGLVVAWRSLMQLTGSAIVLADHAPSAILAARTLDIPVMLFGSGFFMPPPQHPTPALRAWEPLPQERLLAIDQQALTSINTVLARYAKPPLERIADLFQVAETSLLTFPELDHYEHRGPASYWGTLPAASATEPHWPATDGPRVFAYLRPESAHCAAALAMLQGLSGSVLIYAPGLTPQVQARFAAPHLHFSARPLDLTRVAQEADAGVTYASPAATIAFLLAGKPALMLPGHLEQYLLARRVAQMGAGLFVVPDQPAKELPALLQRLLREAVFADNARAFARKYAAFPQTTIVANMVRRIEEICS